MHLGRGGGARFGLTFWENWYVIGANGPSEPEFRFIYYTGKTLESRYQGERSRSYLLLKLGDTENMLILVVAVLAVKFWLLTVPSLST